MHHASPQPAATKTVQPEDDDADPLVEQLGQGCGKIYSALEACLAENDRDWRCCQDNVKALRECYDKAHSLGQQHMPAK